MRKAAVLVLAFAVLLAGVSSAQVRGKGRLHGNVFDDSHKPIEGATVTISAPDTQPILAKTDAKGRWSAIGMTSGRWDVDIEAKGYQTSRESVMVVELQSSKPMITTLKADLVEKAQPVEAAGVPQEIVDAVNLGQEYFKAGKYPEAIVEFEKALPALPDNMGLKQYAAQAYYKAGDLPKAIALLEAVTASPSTNDGVALLLTNLYLENNQLDEAKARLEKISADAITDPTAYLNIGILFLNKNNPSEALTYLTKAVALDANRAELFYYRGLANVQLENNKDAKADFEKVLALAPDSSEGRDAKQLIDSLK